MKSSASVKLWLMPLLSLGAIAAGCGSRGGGAGWQTCVDQGGRVVDEQRCQNEQRSHVGLNPWLYRWYYYPYGGDRYGVGRVVPGGGSYATEPFAGVGTRSMGTPSVGASAPHVGGTSFGGFGGTGAGHSSIGG